MSKPIIFAVDDDPQVLKALIRDLRGEYKREYRILSTVSAEEALSSLIELKKKGETIALFISDQKMPELDGVGYLDKAKDIYPEAKRILLTAYSDTDAAIKAINDVQLDYYLLKPWDPPEEKLFPVINDLLDQWQQEYIPHFNGIKVIGFQYSPKSHAIKDFFSGNLIPYKWLDWYTEPEAKELADLHGKTEKDFPLVILENGEALSSPSLSEIGANIGLNVSASKDVYDVAIIGAGPAGLAAAVYGGSEGLRTILIEKRAPGGQAGTSSRIENYLGFPKGLSGAELSRRAISQATRFGIEFISPQEVKQIEVEGTYKILTLGNGDVVIAKSIVITTGVDYRKLETPGIDDYTGAGVYYGAATTEAHATKDKDVYVVGGGNSAGQGAVYLSNYAKKVHILIRRDDLSSTMSSYLIDQINSLDNIEVVPNTVVEEVHGDGEKLTNLTLNHKEGNDSRKVEAAALFIFIGAKPYTDWLGNNILKDNRGFVATGRDLLNFADYNSIWKNNREPFLLETCNPGIFAAGDVRSGAMNRVASAVGEGAMAISFVHKYLAEV
jgi:thioredoxin reductase (NADPH)